MNAHVLPSDRRRLLWTAVAVVVLSASSVAGARWTDQQAETDDRARLEQLFAALAVKAGAVIADVGAGGGAYSAELARAVGPTGRVLAVDISPRALERLRARIQREGLTNVEVVEGAVDDPRLAPDSVDGVLVVHAYHEMTEHAAMLAKIRQALKASGRLVIVEPISASRRSAARDVQTRAHQLASRYAVQEIFAAGFRLTHFMDPVPSDHAHEGMTEWMLTAQPDGTAR